MVVGEVMGAMNRRGKAVAAVVGAFLWVGAAGAATAAAEPESVPMPMSSMADLTMALATFWVLLGAFLVFFMQAGFGMVEAGFIRAKNTCNILRKNFMDYCLGSVMFFLVGWSCLRPRFTKCP